MLIIILGARENNHHQSQHRSSLTTPKLNHTTKRYLTVPKLPISTKSRFRYATSVLSVTFLPLFPFCAQFYILITAEIEDLGKDT
jgi:hypothetical protein